VKKSSCIFGCEQVELDHVLFMSHRFANEKIVLLCMRAHLFLVEDNFAPISAFTDCTVDGNVQMTYLIMTLIASGGTVRVPVPVLYCTVPVPNLYLYRVGVKYHEVWIPGTVLAKGP
jgi:hypothetical protein